MAVDERIRKIQEELEGTGYVADRPLATALHLVLALHKPLLVEGPAGVGKTESAKALARYLGTRLIRLQCYEGLEASQAIYEWNYPKQLLRIQIDTDSGKSVTEREAQIFSDEFLLRRPILDAITDPVGSPVLLIDEIDRADEAFEAFLLEVLAEFQVTIPEMGTIRATHQPYVILTSNLTRELSDALRRRCLYHWIPYPDQAKERHILSVKLPDVNQRLAEQITRFTGYLRTLPLEKTPGVAESLDWARALVVLHADTLTIPVVEDTLGLVLKDRDDMERLLADGAVSLRRALAAAQVGQNA